MVLGSRPVAVTQTSDFAPAFSKQFHDIEATRECGFTLKSLREMIRTYSQMHRTDKYSRHSSIVWSVWPNAWVFLYELRRPGFESGGSHLNFRYGACFQRGFPSHSGKSECGFTLKGLREMIRTYSQMHRTDKYSQLAK